MSFQPQTHVKTTWKKFKELIPVLSSRHLSFKTCGRVYSSCVRSAMLHASEPWPLTKPSLQCLQQNDRMTEQWSDRSAMLNHKTLPPSGPLSYLHGSALKTMTSYWKREGSTGMDMWNAPTVQSRQPLTYRLLESVGLGGPRWLGSSCREWKLSAIDPYDRDTYLEIRCEICHACSKPVAWKGAHCCGYGPCTCTLIKNLMMMMMMMMMMYKCTGRAIALLPALAAAELGWPGQNVKFYIKEFMWWARCCQVSYPVCRQVLLFKLPKHRSYKSCCRLRKQQKNMELHPYIYSR